jgi:phosphatidylglycerol:prolipoprotein diacylglycerol transferase
MALRFPDINPVALSLGPLKIRWYALAYIAGILAGWRYMLYLIGLDEKRGDGIRRITRLEVDDFLTWAILAIILGGRIGYVVFYNLGLYIHNPVEIFRLWDGGMSFHGGALGVIIAMIVFSAENKLPVLRLTDLVCCAVPIGLFFGRIANFINGELYGRVTTVPWAMIFPTDPQGLPRHPSQLYEAGLEGLTLFLIMAVLARLPKMRDRPGILSGVFLIGYALARIVIENFRQPDDQVGFLFGGFTMGQLLSVPMILFGIVLIARAFAISRRVRYDVTV